MRLAIVAAKFRPEEADRLRRAMATFKRVGTIKRFEKKFIDGMSERGYDRAFAIRCFEQIKGFGEYGFPESHAASFAILVYISSWIKCHYPDVFAAALLNSQPMGFYAPAQIVRDAAEHGVAVRPVDVNLSDWDCSLEEEGPKASERLHRRHAEMRRRYLTRAARCGLASGRSADFRNRTPRPSKASAARASIPCAISGCARGCIRPRWKSSRRPMRFARWA